MIDLADLVTGGARAAQGTSVLAALALLVAAVTLLRRRALDPAARRVAVIAAALVVAGILALVAPFLWPWRPEGGGAAAALGVAGAAASVVAAVLVWRDLPRLLARPPPDALAETSAALEAALARRTRELAETRQRFDLALSSANITLFVQDADLRYTWLQNPRPGLTPEVPGAMADESGAAGGLALKREALATARTRTGEVSVVDPNGDVRHYDLTVIPMPGADGKVDGLLCTAVDVTERRRFDVRLASMAAQAATAYRRLALALEDSPITVFEQDADLRYTFVHNPPPGIVPDDLLGRSDVELFGEGDLRGLGPLKRQVLESGERVAVEMELGAGEAQRFYALRLEPKTAESGAVEGVIGTAVDLTERQRHEQNMKLVMRELTHRSKNLLAVVQAMARKTASAAPDTDSFVRGFSSRLRAIAAAHDILVAESWSGAGLRSLLAASLSQTVDPEAPEIRVEGPDLKLTPDAAQMLALAFHELTMNAAKHGALSVPGGRIAVRWRQDADAVRLRWREEGGPSVAAPRRSGFGRVLLERLVGAALGGSVALEFRPEGLVCDLSFPPDRLIAA